MIQRIRVRDLALIEDAELDLSSSFVVLTGETGAGKSLLVDAVGLLTGMRGSVDSVRSGASRLLVEAEFRPPENGVLIERLDATGITLEPGEALVLRREVSAAGRSRAWINGSLVGLGFLSEIAADLVRIRGQNEAPDLADAATARDALDRFSRLAAERTALETVYRTFRELEDRLTHLRSTEREREGKLDFAKFQLEEIRRVAPKLDEEDELVRERNRLAHASRLREAAAECLELIEDGESAAGDRVVRARKSLAPLATLIPDVDELIRELDEVGERLREVGRRAGRLAEMADDDPKRLDVVEDRLERIRRLLRKHGGTIPDLLEKESELTREIAELSGASNELESLLPERQRALARYGELADALSLARRGGALKFARAISRQLADLGMAGTVLEPAISTAKREGSPIERNGSPIEFGPLGYDRVELLASPNPGEPLRPLSRIASGGELSRIQLALAATLVGKRRGRGMTLVFDEIDAGIGGAAAVAVAKKLRSLADDDQVLCVTHLATIAARATRHYRIAKSTDGERTRVAVEALDGEARVDELARMLAGEPHAREARAHARALLSEAAG